MKKLMIATMALVAGFAMADVESSNVVGYQEVATPQGKSMRVATFKAITGNYKISDIGVTGAAGAGGESVQKVNANGTWGTMYCYLTMEGTGWLEDGWYKEDQVTPVDDTDVIGEGEALFVNATSDIVLTYSGQVISGKPMVPVSTGKSMVGNPTPKQIKISEIEVIGAVGAGGESVQKVNANGTWGAMYCYLTMEGTGWLEDGWYKEDQVTPVDDTDLLDAGDALFVSVTSEVTLTFPAVLQ